MIEIDSQDGKQSFVYDVAGDITIKFIEKKTGRRLNVWHGRLSDFLVMFEKGRVLQSLQEMVLKGIEPKGGFRANPN